MAIRNDFHDHEEKLEDRSINADCDQIDVH